MSGCAFVWCLYDLLDYIRFLTQYLPRTNEDTAAMQKSKRFSEELVGERRGHLERFLRRVQVHPELEGAPSLSSFFSPDAEVFEAAKKDYPVDPTVDETMGETERLTEKVKHFFVKTTVKAKAMRGKDLEETSDGQQMEEIEEYLNTVSVHVKSLAKTTLALVKISEDTSKNMHELGQTLFGLHQTYDPEKSSKNESKEMSTLPSLKTISSVFGSLSAIHKVKYDDNTSKVTQQILDIENSIKSARLAIQRRKEKQITYNTYLQQIKNRTQTLEKLQNNVAVNSPGGGSSSEAKVGDAQRSLESARQASKAAMDELIQVTERVFREMDRFKHNLDEELRGVYARHARVQVDYSKQMDGEYNKLLGHGGRSSNGSGGKVDLIKNGGGDAEVMMI